MSESRFRPGTLVKLQKSVIGILVIDKYEPTKLYALWVGQHKSWAGGCQTAEEWARQEKREGGWEWVES